MAYNAKKARYITSQAFDYLQEATSAWESQVRSTALWIAGEDGRDMAMVDDVRAAVRVVHEGALKGGTES